jgi:uncharacterized protein with HEPN domain
MTQTQFTASELHQDAAIRSLEVIGEAASPDILRIPQRPS